MENKVRVYLDNCCFNRPYDNQSQLRIEIETKAKLFIQNLIYHGKLELAWSYVLDYENSKNPHFQKSNAIKKWRELAYIDVDETPGILETGKQIRKTGIKNADSLHIACAIYAGCDYFISTDDRVVKYVDYRIKIINPISFLSIWEDSYE